MGRSFKTGTYPSANQVLYANLIMGSSVTAQPKIIRKLELRNFIKLFLVSLEIHLLVEPQVPKLRLRAHIGRLGNSQLGLNIKKIQKR